MMNGTLMLCRTGKALAGLSQTAAKAAMRVNVHGRHRVYRLVIEPGIGEKVTGCAISGGEFVRDMA